MISERDVTPCMEQTLNGFWQHLGTILQRIGKIITRWDQLSQQRRQLREMDDRMLQDIGLSQADVTRITGRRFWEDPLRSEERVDERYRSADFR